VLDPVDVQEALGTTAGRPVAPDVFDAQQRAEVARALEDAGRATGLTFSLRIGAAEGAARPYALRLHADRGAEPPDTVLVFVDPKARKLEIVTGSRARRRVDDATCARAAEAMTAAFARRDLTGGILAGLRVLGAPRAGASRSRTKPAKTPPQSQSTLF
jgi:hypothetical protein